MTTQPIPAGQADEWARRLLVVDFDFCFPNPLEAGAADSQTLRLFDWGHAETLLHRETMWPVRAAMLAAEGVPLPRCESTTGFWDRFTLGTDVLLVADSNAYAGPLAWEGGFDEVLLFDLSVPSGAMSSTSATTDATSTTTSGEGVIRMCR